MALITQIHAMKCSYCPSMWKIKLSCNCDGFVGTNPSQLHESLHVGATSVIFHHATFEKIKAGCFVCHQ